MTEIDFVITWVDGTDSAWLAERKKYSMYEGDDTVVRFRDWDLLRYWFRSVEKYAPWVRKIHFVTWGHVPEWLDTNSPKLNVVKHSDFIPPQYLPTFNSHTIELNLHRIKGLSEKFVYFNDDVFINRPVSPSFFFKDGYPCDCFSLEGIYFSSRSIGWINGSCVAVINDCFPFLQSVRKNWRKYFSCKNGWKKVVKSFLILLCCRDWFTGFYHAHTSYTFLKASFDAVWKYSYDVLDETCRHKFRGKCDVSPRVIKNWQLASGNFTPASAKSLYCCHLTDKRIKNAAEMILQSKYGVICINDTEYITDFKMAQKQIKDAFEYMLPQKCSFEQ